MYNLFMNILQEFDTIAAIATPIGTGGVGVIRISGDKSFEIIDKIYSKHNIEAGKISHGWIVDGGKKIDEVLLLPFKNPHSYTGEDVIEIHCHGGINVVRNILDVVLKNGARMAERGEFTKRAFLNKKMDLSQAEAVADLIHAKTKDFAKQSAKNLSGVLSTKIKEIRTDIFNVLSKIIAGIDFPEDVHYELCYEVTEGPGYVSVGNYLYFTGEGTVKLLAYSRYDRSVSVLLEIPVTDPDKGLDADESEEFFQGNLQAEGGCSSVLSGGAAMSAVALGIAFLIGKRRR